MALLYFAFFLSGFGSLVHEVVWQRMLVTLFGSTVYATSTVLFIFMAGLGVGAYLAPRIVKKQYAPAKAYALCEAGIALYAVLFPVIFHILSFLDGFVPYGAPGIQTACRFFISFIFLIPPVFLMGASFPFFIALFSEDKNRTALASYAYALNTFGGAAGTLTAGFFLIKHLGLTGTQIAAACASLIAAALVLFAGRRARNTPAPDSSFTLQPVHLAVFFSGMLSLFCEVVFTRALISVFGSTVYAFSLLLFSFLSGIFLGSFLAGNLLSSSFKKPPLYLYFIALAGALILSRILAGKSPYIFLSIIRHYDATLFRYHSAQLLTALAALFAPAFMFGSVFSACLFHVRSENQTETGAASLYAVNSAGSCAGALVVIPCIVYLGLEGSLMLAAALSLAFAVGFSFESRGGSTAVSIPCSLAGCVLLLVLPGWNTQVLNQGVFQSGIALMTHEKGRRDDPELLAKILGANRKLLFYYEGLHSTVAVTQLNNNTSLKINGRTNASTSKDMLTQLISGYLPMLFHRQPENIMVVGMGSGVTLKAVLDFPVKHVDMLELEKGVIYAAPFFDRVNAQSYKDARVRIIVDDGRQFLQKNKNKYDVIISEPSHPWFGTNSLFTREFYETAYDRLNDGGIMAQWIGAYGLDVESTKTAVRTFLSVFDDVATFEPLITDVILIGRKKGGAVSLSGIEEKMKKHNIQNVLKPYFLDDPVVFLAATFLLGPEDLKKYSGSGKTNSDTFPVIEFAGADAIFLQNLDIANHHAMAIHKTAFFPQFLTGAGLPLNQKQLFQIARAKLRQQNPEDLLGIVNRLLDDYPKAPVLHHMKGQAHVMLSGIPDAAAAFAEEVRLKPDSAFGWFDLSLCYRYLGDKKRAEDALRNALRLNPNLREADVPFGSITIEPAN